ncbi:MAG: hypothetical protein JSU83_21150 [Deltaproteobacteria bacterium]|nr:MAG: hypothetical protein JSU83_21150 [Deltaproteobacteria bacterium]
MRNPFIEFHPDRFKKREHHAERIITVKEDVIGKLTEGYLQILEEEIDNLSWMVEHHHIVNVDEKILDDIQYLEYSFYDIEAFCAQMDNADSLQLMVPGPAGLYISALINNSKDGHFVLRLADYQYTFHFLGYRLPENATLILEGNAGDFIGAALNGGSLIINGSVGNWCGAGMLNGDIQVKQNAGEKTGEWMHGGAIRVNDSIGSIGETRYGGQILQHGKSVD